LLHLHRPRDEAERFPEEEGFHYESDDQDHEPAHKNGENVLPLHIRTPGNSLR
jgi:hypothetical protein